MIKKPEPIIKKIEPNKFIKFIKKYKKYSKLHIKDVKFTDNASIYITDNNKFIKFTMSKDENNKYKLAKSTIEKCKIWDNNGNEIKFKKINPNFIVKQLLEDYSTREINLKSFSIQNAFNKISLVVDDNNFKIDLEIKLSNGDNIYYKNF